MHKPGHIQISVPTPCHEDWDKMTPLEQGRFCASCQKYVTDFTRFTDRELYEFFQQHKGEKVCGRFYGTQLNRLIALPPQPHSQLYKWIIAAGLTLLFTAAPDTKIFAQTPFAQEQTTQLPDPTTTGTIEGIITDDRGMPMDSVKVVLQEGGIIMRSTYTHTDGSYRITGILPGRYDLVAKAPYFSIHIVTGVVIAPGRQIKQDIKMDRAIKEVVIVEYKVPLIDKFAGDGTEVFITGEVIESRQPVQIPDSLIPTPLPEEPLEKQD